MTPTEVIQTLQLDPNDITTAAAAILMNIATTEPYDEKHNVRCSCIGIDHCGISHQIQLGVINELTAQQAFLGALAMRVSCGEFRAVFVISEGIFTGKKPTELVGQPVDKMQGVKKIVFTGIMADRNFMVLADRPEDETRMLEWTIYTNHRNVQKPTAIVENEHGVCITDGVCPTCKRVFAPIQFGVKSVADIGGGVILCDLCGTVAILEKDASSFREIDPDDLNKMPPTVLPIAAQALEKGAEIRERNQAKLLAKSLGLTPDDGTTFQNN